MKTCAFDVRSLPHVPSADFAAARRMAQRFGDGSRHATLTVAPFGRLALTFSFFGPSTPPDEAATLWRVRLGSDQGWLTIEDLGALRIVAAMLGISSPRIHRKVKTTERGVLAAAIVAISRVALAGCSVGSAMPCEWSGAGLARLRLQLDSSTFRQEVFLDVPPNVIHPHRPDSLHMEMRRRDLKIPMVLEVARTSISTQEWANARPGDAVVFDSHCSNDFLLDELPAQVLCGSFHALAAIDKEGSARIIGPFTPVVRHERNAMSDDSRVHVETMIAAAPIEVVAECGRFALRADEIMALRPGSVVPLGSPGPSTIQLRVGGLLWASGELVDVGGQLGVRLTSLAGPMVSRELPPP